MYVIKVVNKQNPREKRIYENVMLIRDVYDSGKKYHELVMPDSTASFIANEWTFYTRDWVELVL